MTRYSAISAAGGLESLATMGFDSANAIAALPKLTAMATQGKLELADAAMIASDAMGNLGLMYDKLGNMNGPKVLAANMSRVADVLSYAGKATSTDIVGLYEALKEAGPIAAMAGLSFEKFMGMTGALAQAGIKGSVAGTSMKNILTRMLSPTSEGFKEFAHLKIDDKKFRALMDPLDQLQMITDSISKLSREDKVKAIDEILGKIPMAAGGRFLNGGVASARLLERDLFEKAPGSTERSAALVMEGTQAKLDVLSNKFANLRIAMFDALQGPQENAIDGLSRAIEKQGPNILKFANDVSSRLSGMTEKDWSDVGDNLETAGQAAGIFATAWATMKGVKLGGELLAFGKSAAAMAGSVGSAVAGAIATTLVGAAGGVAGLVTAGSAAAGYYYNEKTKSMTEGLGTLDLISMSAKNMWANMQETAERQRNGDFSGAGNWRTTDLAALADEYQNNLARERRAKQDILDGSRSYTPEVANILDRYAEPTKSKFDEVFDAGVWKNYAEQSFTPLESSSRQLTSVFDELAERINMMPIPANDFSDIPRQSSDYANAYATTEPGVMTTAASHLQATRELQETIQTNNATVEVRAAKGTEARQVKAKGATPIKLRRTGTMD